MRLGLRFAGMVLTSLLMMGAATVPVWGQDSPTESRQFKDAEGTIVENAQSLIATGQFSAAISNLNVALDRDLTPYERSTIYQVLGSAYYEQENYPQTISSFENAIKAGGLLPKESTALRLNIAQLLIASGRYREGATMLENYLKEGNPSKPAYVDMMVGACVQAEDYACALPWAEKWFDAASPKERKHFDLLNFLYNNLGMTGKQADIVKQMLQRFPEDRTLWDTWAFMLSNGGREDDAFEVKKMLYLGGALTSESDLLQLVQYYSYYEMPYQAAQILERELNAGRITRETKNLVYLSDLYRQAREYKRVIPILEQVTVSAKSEMNSAQLGESYAKDEQCEKAEAAFKQSFALGYDKGKAWMHIGVCFYELSTKLERIDCEMTEAQIAVTPRNKMRDRASAAFRNVPSVSTHSGDAFTWRKFIKAEKRSTEYRCRYNNHSIRDDLCYNDLANAYKARVFTGGELKLNDPSCMQFKEDYDKIYIVKKTDG